MKLINVLVTTSFFHFFQDGFVYSIFILIPFIAKDFRLSFSQSGLLKTGISGISSLFQIPAVFVSEKVGEAYLLVSGLGCLSLGYLMMASSASFIILLIIACIAGLGHSVQHPIATSMVSKLYENGRLGISVGALNLSGDIGKVCVPFVVTLIVAAYGWRSSLQLLGILGILISVVTGILKRSLFPPEEKDTASKTGSHDKDSVFSILKNTKFLLFSLIGIIDCSTRMATFTFVPFLSMYKGVGEGKVGFIVTLIFFGGIFGKFVCGYLLDKLGGEKVIMITQLLTATLLGLMLNISLLFHFALVAIVLGVVVNGSSSVFYSLVAYFFQKENRSRGYALFFTIYLSAGAIGPVLYGKLGDFLGLYSIFISMSIATLLTLPLTGLLIKLNRISGTGLKTFGLSV